MTALICLHHLDDEPLRPAGYTDRQVIDALRERAAEADWDDELLRSEIDTLPSDAGWLAEVVDELIEAAWGCAQAYERVLAARQRFGIPELYEDAITPQLARLMAGLSGARDRVDEQGHLQVADYRAGAGDLLMAVRHELGDHDPLAIYAIDPDPFLARVLRRRLVVQGLSRGSWQVELGPGPARSTSPADVVLLHLPYRPTESRTDTDPFAEINEVTRGLAPGQTAVVLGRRSCSWTHCLPTVRRPALVMNCWPPVGWRQSCSFPGPRFLPARLPDRALGAPQGGAVTRCRGGCCSPMFRIEP